jgi:hypothetical protein
MEFQFNVRIFSVKFNIMMYKTVPQFTETNNGQMRRPNNELK